MIKHFLMFMTMPMIIIAAAAREPEVTEQGSTLIGTDIYVWGLLFSFLVKCKDCGR